MFSNADLHSLGSHNIDKSRFYEAVFNDEYVQINDSMMLRKMHKERHDGKPNSTETLQDHIGNNSNDGNISTGKNRSRNRFEFALSLSPIALPREGILTSNSIRISNSCDFADSSIWHPNSISPELAATASITPLFGDHKRRHSSTETMLNETPNNIFGDDQLKSSCTFSTTKVSSPNRFDSSPGQIGAIDTNRARFSRYNNISSKRLDPERTKIGGTYEQARNPSKPAKPSEKLRLSMLPELSPQSYIKSLEHPRISKNMGHLVYESHIQGLPSYYACLDEFTSPDITQNLLKFAARQCMVINNLRYESTRLEKLYVEAAAAKTRAGGICAPDKIISEFESLRKKLTFTRFKLAEITKDFQFFRKFYKIKARTQM